MWLKVLVLIAVAVCHTKAETASDALILFAGNQNSIAIQSYDDNSDVEGGWTDYMRNSESNYLALQRALCRTKKCSGINESRLLISLPVLKFIKRQLNAKRVYYEGIETDWDSAIEVYMTSTANSLNEFLADVQGSRDALIDSGNPFQSENQALLTYFDDHVASMAAFNQNYYVNDDGINSAGGKYLDQMIITYNTLVGALTA